MSEKLQGDALSAGGVFMPEMEIQAPEMTEEEIQAQKEFEREVKELRILANSPAWQRIKEAFLKEINEMKHNMAQTVANQGSLDKIGEEFKIGYLCEQKLKSLIDRVEQSREVENE